jgi:hypothetical protein
MLYRNVASQKVAVYAYDTSADAPKTGDAGNITAYISKDGGSATQSNDVNPTEIDATNMKGLYLFDLTQAESQCELFVLSAVSSTSNIVLDPVVVFTFPASGSVVVEGEVDDTSFSPTTSAFETDITEATADHYNGRVIIFTSGNLVDQACVIQDYELVGGRGKFTVSTLTEAPANGDDFVII